MIATPSIHLWCAIDMRYRGCIAALVFVVTICWSATIGFSYYENRSINELKKIIDGDLNSASDMGDIENFMRSHTEGYELDEVTNFSFSGISKQSSIDRIIFDRKFQINIFFDPVNRNYKSNTINVYYTFL